MAFIEFRSVHGDTHVLFNNQLWSSGARCECSLLEFLGCDEFVRRDPDAGVIASLVQNSLLNEDGLILVLKLSDSIVKFIIVKLL